MKQFSRGDVVPWCGGTIEADSEAELHAKDVKRARKDHETTSVPDEVIAQVKAKISER